MTLKQADFLFPQNDAMFVQAGDTWIPRPIISSTLPETNSSPMKIPMFPCKYHQNGGFSMAMLVLGRVSMLNLTNGWNLNIPPKGKGGKHRPKPSIFGFQPFILQGVILKTEVLIDSCVHF